jgi:hypothetical protein
MPDFMRQAIACSLAIMTPETELVFASRYGDMTTTVSMLEAIGEQDLLSPTAFSSAVHNAAAGLAHQILNLRLSHTAVAAGPDSFGAGLVEAWLRLATGEATSVALVCGDLALPEPFAACGDSGVPRFVGLRLEKGGAGAAFDWAGSRDLDGLITALTDGACRLRVPVLA